MSTSRCPCIVFLVTAGMILFWRPVHLSAADSQDALLRQVLEQLQAVNERFDRIEARLDALEAQQPPAAAGQQPGPAAGAGEREEDINYLQEDVEEIFDRLDETEKRTLMDKIDFGLAMRTRVDNIHWEDRGAGVETNNDNFWSSRFRLRMRADVSEHLKFTGRMSVYKNWSDADFSGKIWDAAASETPSDTTVRLDRAYVDLIFSDFVLPVALTVGRQPTVGGMPVYLRDNTAARSTYPALLYERETDAACMTLGLSKWTGWEQSALRIMYGKFLQPDNDQFFYLDDKGEDVDMLWLQAETRLPGALLDTSVTATYIRNWNMPGAPFEAITSQPGNLGYNEVWGLSVISMNIMDTGLDWFISYGHSAAHANGNTILADFNNDGAPESLGMLSRDGQGTFKADAWYTGLRYTLPAEFLNNPKIGVEYNHASRYWWSPTLGADDPFNKLAARGDAWEFYYIQPFLEHALLRLGYLGIDYDYKRQGGGPIGPPLPRDQELTTWYLLLDIHF